MVTIRIEQKMTPELLAFAKKEWQTADMEHHHKVVNWEKHTRILTAYENTELVGILELSYSAGVMHIEELIVSYPHHKKGLGTALMEKAEKIAQEAKLHKIYLETGKTWAERAFYEKLGYIMTGELPKHNVGDDYVMYSKFFDGQTD